MDEGLRTKGKIPIPNPNNQLPAINIIAICGFNIAIMPTTSNQQRSFRVRIRTRREDVVQGPDVRHRPPVRETG